MSPQESARQLSEWKRLVETMPDAVRDAIPLHLWDRTKLYALDLPVRQIEVLELHWMLDIPLWAVDGVPFQITPNQALAHPDRYPEQYRRVLEAHLSFPIHILWHNERWTILDGVHRLLKAVMEGQASITAMVLSADDYRAILVPGYEANA